MIQQALHLSPLARICAPENGHRYEEGRGSLIKICRIPTGSYLSRQ